MKKCDSLKFGETIVFQQNIDFYDTNYDEVSNLFRDKKNIFIYKGIFPVDTGKFIKNKKFKFVHLDVDQYESHKLAMEFFYEKMVVGGYILFDDYNSPVCEGATLAVNEFLADKIEDVQHAGENVYYLIKENTNN